MSCFQRCFFGGFFVGVCSALVLFYSGYERVGGFSIYVLVPLLLLAPVSLFLRQFVPGAVDKYGLPQKDISTDQAKESPRLAATLRGITGVGLFLFGWLIVYSFLLLINK
jgi:hypothetical protein